MKNKESIIEIFRKQLDKFEPMGLTLTNSKLTFTPIPQPDNSKTIANAKKYKRLV